MDYGSRHCITRADERAEPGVPGQAPFTRGTHADVDGFGWQILTLIDGGTPGEANRAILADLEGGSNGIVLQIAAHRDKAAFRSRATEVLARRWRASI